MYNYSHPHYLAARQGAFMRSGGVCQQCGSAPATDAHHWACRYPREDETTADDLTALCATCHEVATIIRRHIQYGGQRAALLAKFREASQDAL